MKQFSWKIASVDKDSGHMVVEYTHEDRTKSLNIPIPPVSEDPEEWVSMYAPVVEWSRTAADLHDLKEGVEGSGEFASAGEGSASESPNVAGSWNEEYLRAMIYQVMEEIRESEV